jgi:SAM-dependent methyltransferase
MNDWTAGYVADIGYTYGYYTELNPLRARLALLHAGLACPKVGTACELGFGQGLSVNVHAAASSVAWCGTDFNPSQAAFAQSLARASGSVAKLYDEAFAEFAARSDLPDFDFIGLHGIWSWISDENRAVLVDFLRRKLKVGGVLYVSYNTLPGWSGFAPMRHLMVQHAQVMGSEGQGIVGRIDAAIEFAQRLMATNPAFARAHPQVAERLNRVKGQSRQYLAHEYFNRDWHPMYFATMAGWLQPAKLDFACSAHQLDLVDVVNLSADQRALMRDMPDPVFRESTRDYLVNQQFRRDYWVKGGRKLSTLEQREAIAAERVTLLCGREEVQLKMTTGLGEVTMSEAVYGPLLDALTALGRPTLGELEDALRPHRVSLQQIVEALFVLAGMGKVTAAVSSQESASAQPTAHALNRRLMDLARGSNEVAYLASPVTGGGLQVGRIQQLFLRSVMSGAQQPSEWAAEVWRILESQGHRLMKDGRKLDDVQENQAELLAQAEAFARERLELLRRLEVF